MLSAVILISAPMKLFAFLALLLGLPFAAAAKPLTIGYSDWPGWIAWDIALQKKWFEEEGVEVSFKWMDYVASMDAYAGGELDAVCMTNGDALVTGATGKRSTAILLNDFSFGNDMVVGAPGISNLEDLVGESVALEEGFVPHLLFLEGLKERNIDPATIKIVNTPTDKVADLLKAGAVKAVAAWQPNSGDALRAVPGAQEIFSSADAPGIIFDGLFVDRDSLKANQEDWQKVTKVWYRVVEFIKDEANQEQVLEILSRRAGLSPTEYEPLLEGTYILSLKEALRCWGKRNSLSSIYGSTGYVNRFNVENGVYKEPEKVSDYFDPTFTFQLEQAKRASK